MANEINDIKEIIDKAEPALVMRSLRAGLIPFYALVSNKSTGEGRKLLNEYLELQERIERYVEEQYSQNNPS